MKTLKMNPVRSTALVLFSGLAVYMVGCGSNSQPTPPPPPPIIQPPNGAYPGYGHVACQPGQLPGSCAPVDFTSGCYAAGGAMITLPGAPAGAQICKKSFYFVSPYSYFTFTGDRFFPRLSADQPSSPYAYSTGIQVRTGDTLTYSGTGSWGSTSSDSYSALGGIFNFTTWSRDCHQVGIDGVKDGQTVTNGGLPAGLVASDGTEVFLLGKSATHLIANNGMLSIGFNVPAETGSCAEATLTKLKVTRCEDSTGVTYPCQTQ